MRRLVYTLCLFFIVLVAACRTPRANDSQSASVSQASTDLFAKDEILDLSITAPLTDMFAHKDDMAFHEIDWDIAADDDPAWVSQGVSVDMPQKTGVPAQLRVRGGVSRNCDFPPLKIKFKKADAKGTPFAGHKALKIITHCGDDDDFLRVPARSDVLFRIFQVISPHAFHTHFANVHYRDNAHSLDITRDGMLLEDMESLSDRLHLQGEVMVPALTAAKPVSVALDDDVNNERQDSQLGAMLQTLRLEALDAKRQELARLHPELSADAIEEQVRGDQAKILTDAGLPPLLAPITDLSRLSPKLEAALKDRSQAIAAAQETFRRQLSDQDMAKVLAFQIFILNTDWDIFGLRDWMGPGASSLNVKNMKVLNGPDKSYIPVPYDFDLADVFSRPSNYPSTYQNHLKRILGGLSSTTQPSRDHFVSALKEIIQAESQILALIAASHLKDEEKKQLSQAVACFVTVSQTLLAP